MPVAGRGPATKDLLDRAALLRERIDYRRGILVQRKPAVDHLELAMQVARLETDLARVEKILVARGRAVIRAFTHEDK